MGGGGRLFSLYTTNGRSMTELLASEQRAANGAQYSLPAIQFKSGMQSMASGFPLTLELGDTTQVHNVIDILLCRPDSIYITRALEQRSSGALASGEVPAVAVLMPQSMHHDILLDEENAPTWCCEFLQFWMLSDIATTLLYLGDVFDEDLANFAEVGEGVWGEKKGIRSMNNH
jgi:hypothetical protein